MAQANHSSTTTRGPGARPTIQAAHTALIGCLAANKPHRITGNADALDIRDRAEHLEAVLAAVTEYALAVVTDTANDTLGPVDRRTIQNRLVALASEVVGAVTTAAMEVGA